MLKIKNILYLIILAILNGCAATGTSYQDRQSNVIEEQKARLVLFRTRESMVGYARTVSVKIDGKPVQGVKYGGYTLLETSPGGHILTVDLPDTLGKCLLPLEAKSGQEYFFQIRPRIESLNLGGAAYAVLADGQPAAPKREDCKGSFYIEQLEANIALEKLKDLKSDK